MKPQTRLLVTLIAFLLSTASLVVSSESSFACKATTFSQESSKKPLLPPIPVKGQIASAPVAPWVGRDRDMALAPWLIPEKKEPKNSEIALSSMLAVVALPIGSDELPTDKRILWQKWDDNSLLAVADPGFIGDDEIIRHTRPATRNFIGEDEIRR